MVEFGREISEGPLDIFVDMNNITEEEGKLLISRNINLSQSHNASATLCNKETFEDGTILKFDKNGRLSNASSSNTVFKYEYDDNGNLLLHSTNDGETLTVETYTYRTDMYGADRPNEIAIQRFKTDSMLALTQRRIYSIGPVQDHENY